MQASYALLMLRQKAALEHPERCSSDVYVQTLFVRCHRALRSIVATLDNYSIAAEAIGGMRGTLNLSSDGKDPCHENGTADIVLDQILESISMYFDG